MNNSETHVNVSPNTHIKVKSHQCNLGNIHRGVNDENSTNKSHKTNDVVIVHKTGSINAS